MEYDLIRKGLTRQQIEDAMEGAGPSDERPLIRELAEKKLKTMDEEDPKTRGKLAAFLARKGFRTEDVLSVLEEFFS